MTELVKAVGAIPDGWSNLILLLAVVVICGSIILCKFIGAFYGEYTQKEENDEEEN